MARYPWPAALAQSYPDDVASAARLLIAFLMVAARHGLAEREKLDELVAEVRKGARTSNRNHRFLLYLQRQDLGDVPTIRRLRDVIDVVPGESKNDTFIKSIRGLLAEYTAERFVPPASPVVRPPLEGDDGWRVPPQWSIRGKRPPSEDDDSTASPPDEIDGGLAPETAADAEAVPSDLEHARVRYNNYLTQLGVQRLPWSWGELNPLELMDLMAGLRAGVAARDPEALLLALSAFTGKSVEEVTRLGWSDDAREDGLTRSGDIRRRLVEPPLAWAPQDDEAAECLETHTSALDLRLPQELAHALAALAGAAPLGEALGLSGTDAEARTSRWLERLRETTGARLLRGRIRGILASQLMRATGDAVIVHHLAGRRTDMPPAGVYYVRYPARLLEGVYARVVAAIWSGTP